MGCSPEIATEKFTEMYERTGAMPSFKEVAEVSINPDLEERYVYGQGCAHVANAPFKIRLLKKNPHDPNEPARFAMCRCGCPECRPSAWKFSTPPENLTKWGKRGLDLSKNPGGREGFNRLLRELKSHGVELAKGINP